MDSIEKLAAALRLTADALDELPRSEPRPALPDPPMRRLLPYAGAAAYLGISVRSMKQLGKPGGQVGRVQIGARVLFDRVDLDEYVERIK